jgi:hypothetical protein
MDHDKLLVKDSKDQKTSFLKLLPIKKAIQGFIQMAGIP